MEPEKRFLSFDIEHLRQSKEGIWFAVDLMMLLLLGINLTLIIIDSIYRLDFIESFIASEVSLLEPPLTWLKMHFFVIDAVFVSIFLSEFCIRWLVAVRHATYHRWFYYPFIHWYDLVGCIPLTGARMLRFLRVFSIIYRLHKYRIIDIRQSSVYQFLAFYYDVLLEELSDRVIIKVLSGIQRDIEHDNTLNHRIINELVTPRLERLSASGALITSSIAQAMHSEADHPFSVQLRKSVVSAMRNNEDLVRLKSVPFVGDQLVRELETAVAQIVIDTIAGLIGELPDLMKAESLRESLRTGEAAWTDLDQEILDLIHEILEFAKSQVARQQWKARLEH
ncbi:hypothetical protein BTA51_27275 [Hahella sp. CCB-MM4]|uniref:hypothetical protein n=1 Tax=Hahella sp. (strain CCB-MM4) TaxID=1926491 RepID=UPI000B9B8B67|nr:hypothetical protein [Hahella sp. CCB-MM4]OZG70179.1 hypothetical protein BTA51_27275 [Hahella sp. CCB-MM4]